MRATTATTIPTSVVYVTRDIERALGATPGEHYYIVANTTPYAEEIRAQYPEYVFLVESKEPLDTYNLLTNPEVQDMISEKMSLNNDIALLVFKNTSRIEKLCADKKWNLLNPSSSLAEKIENKITQIEWLGDLTRYLPRFQVTKMSDLAWGVFNQNKSPFIIQWAHSHTGDGTALVRNEKELNVVKEKFPAREARVTEYIRGPMFTANICVNDNAPKNKKTGHDILVGNISYQITGILPFTDNPFSTIGNDWSVPHSILSPEKIEQFNEIAQAVGERMKVAGWHGLFGIDCIYDEERDTIHLIEINARQPASVTFESQLQNSFRNQFHNESLQKNSTIFEAHIVALLGSKLSTKKSTELSTGLIEINDGAQIIQRLTVSANILMETPEKITLATDALRAENLTVIEYPNTKANSDILRIQSARGIMEAHMKFNARGKKIVDILLA